MFGYQSYPVYKPEAMYRAVKYFTLHYTVIKTRVAGLNNGGPVQFTFHLKKKNQNTFSKICKYIHAVFWTHLY